MDVDELRRIRDEAVAEMHHQIELVEPVDLPYWILMSMMLPLFMGAALKMTGRMLWTLVMGWIKSPFSFLAIWTDLLGIMWWFLRSSVKRMSNDDH